MRTSFKVAAAVLAVVALAVAIRTLPIAAWLEEFTRYVQGLGAAGWILYIAVYAICCVLLIPASALTIGAGAIFGFAAGSMVVLAGATLGASAAFLLGRTVLRGRVESVAASSPRLRAMDRAIARDGTKVMLLMRISGFPPFTWINYA
ncbi:MAG TPA: VTT domain-containing protein, partial [Thermoanaerobaculia bacterium]|nr:VTT domain-containing protein [Thermoanaerobaculia bacterium]